ncbi:MAG: tRNA lysidine(34) synthetase TilS [Stappia sp.]|nr:tRNA lysidine(34) synthetase TilS [Stappia sp.]
MAAPPEAGGPVSDREADIAFACLSGLSRIALAVSGGPDSMAMLHLVACWRDRTPDAPDCLVLTLDHGLRPEARAETRMVERAAARHGLTCRVLHWEGEKPRSGLQAAARGARQRLLGAACLEARAEALVLAHHFDDQAETVLMRLRRGSGIFGLAGMRRESAWPRQDARPLTVLRPLLDFGKARLEATCQAADLAFARDPSNSDPAYARVRLRAELPELAGLGLTAQRLCDLARDCANAADTIDAEVERRLAAHGTCHPAGLFTLDLEAFEAASALLRERLVVRVLAAFGAGGYAPRRDRLARFLDRLGLAGAGRGGDAERAQATLSGVVARRDGARLLVWREAGRGGIGSRMLNGPCEILWDGRFVVRVEDAVSVEVVARGELAARIDGQGAAGQAARDRLAEEDRRRPKGFPRAALAACPCLVPLWKEAGDASYCPGLSTGPAPAKVSIRPLLPWSGGQAAELSGISLGKTPESVET